LCIIKSGQAEKVASKSKNISTFCCQPSELANQNPTKCNKQVNKIAREVIFCVRK